MDPIAVVGTAVWAMLPAYLPNNVAVIAGGGRPIDHGRKLGDRRLLGAGKTWRGTVIGAAAGIALAFVLTAVVGPVQGVVGIELPRFSPSAMVTLPVGAMVGDIAGSFLKRRTGRSRGAPLPGVDQLDFVIGALGLTAVVDTSWFLSIFTLPVVVVVIVVTPVLHVATNVVAYLLGLKQEPW